MGTESHAEIISREKFLSNCNCNLARNKSQNMINVSNIFVGDGTIGPCRITPLISQEFSGATELKCITPTNSLSFFCVVGDVSCLVRTRVQSVWRLRLLTPQKLFDVIGSIITLANSRKKHNEKCNPGSSYGNF